LPVRLFVANLPYNVTEPELRGHFSALGALSHVVLPVDRETGRPRGFAFVEYVDRADAETAISRFNGQLFQGRPLAVSEARAREDRPPASRPAGGFGPRPTPIGSGPPGPRDRPSRSFGPPAPARRQHGKAGGRPKAERGPKGPIRERSTGRVFDVEGYSSEDEAELDNVALSDTDTEEPEDGSA
jgi:cold-inducible RNA-binding protein